MMLVYAIVAAFLLVGANGQDWNSTSTNCNGHCAYGSCYSDGSCTDGCKEGWYGGDCDRRCEWGCSDGMCEQWTGACTSGCVNETMGGLYCDEPCEIGCSDGWDSCMPMEDYWCSWDEQCPRCICQGLSCMEASDGTLGPAMLSPVLLVPTLFLIKLFAA